MSNFDLHDEELYLIIHDLIDLFLDQLVEVLKIKEIVKNVPEFGKNFAIF